MEKNLGHATAYGYAKSKGYSGTEDEFAQLMADYASVGQSAAQSAEQAAASATSASGSAATASQAAQTATSKASEAVTAADTATTKASEASQSASTASAAATSASTSAQTATTAAATATTKASEASESAATATTAKTDAESARDAAAQSASEAAASAASIDPETLEHMAYGAYVVESTSGSVASFPDGADSIPMKDVIVHIEPVQAGSGDPSPENVRPITGWTMAKVTRTGKNLINIPDGAQTVNGVTTTISDGIVTLAGTATSRAVIYLARNLFIPAGSFRLNGAPESFPVGCYLNFSSGNGISVSEATNNHDVSFTLNSPSTAAPESYIRIDIASGTNTDGLVLKPMIRNSDDIGADYEPYHADTYSITFTTEAGTVYGGVLDVTRGVLTVDRAMVTLDGSNNESIINTTGEYANTALWSSYSSIGTKNAIFISDKLKTINPSAASVSANLWNVWCSTVAPRMWFSIPKTLTTNEGLRAYLAENPITVIYPLATPITYQLTPQEITSLLGTNNLWADTGNSDVEYRADTKMYITKKITEAVSALS